MPDTCAMCRAPYGPDAVICEPCGTPRYASYAVMLAEHVLEHIADGLTEPVEILRAMVARPIRSYAGLTLAQVAQQVRLLTKDTSALARALVKARSARTMIEVLETGDAKDKISVLAKWGPETNAEHVAHSGEIALPTRVEHVYLSSTGGYLPLP